MGKPKIRPPSKVNALSFPVFGLTWHGTPATPKNDGVSFTAYCGGGGSAKTGVGNKIVCDLVAQEPQQQQPGGEHDNLVNQSSSSTTSHRTIEISTGEALCFGIHAFRPYDDTLQMIRLVACVGDEILLYGIPIHCSSSNDDGSAAEQELNEGAILLAKANVGNGYGANVATYTAMFHVQQNQLQHLIAVGCENGHLVVFQIATNNASSSSSSSCELTKITECKGHTKAICAIQFHPRGQELLSSAKDGTARIFSVSTGNELAVMKCEVHDPNGPPPPTTTTIDPSKSSTIKTKDPRMMKRAPQILVRGCAYGDLEGKTIYTIASGKRGAAFLTQWKTLVSLGNNNDQQQQQQQLNIRQEYRVQCSPVPISATSLSSDCTIFALGSVEGSILLYNLETKSVLKQFKEVHDLPVTCLASRPIPTALMLPGELEGGVNFDAVSASADNRMGCWTLQKRSRIKPVRVKSSSSYSRKKGPVEQFVWNIVRIPLLLLLVLVMVAIRDVTVVCREEFGMPAVLLDMGAAGHCLYREVLWAEDTRPGIKFVPV
mmetsp:Transcript_3120/g.5142  ORF Transcript_3120/g.5142 Transcript_3120/m.5142 type:complete len:546 (+) Transcript_3120:118-1755(+)